MMAESQDFALLAQGIRHDLAPVFKDVWGDRPQIIPKWAVDIASTQSISRVLELARHTTNELEVPGASLLSVHPSELAVFWAQVLRRNCDQEPTSKVELSFLEASVAKSVATSVYAMHQQSTRYRNFLQFGPPPGVREFPVYSASERTKTMAIPWRRIASSAQPTRSVQYQSCTSSRPKRIQSLRSQTCTPSDIKHPSLFT